MRVISGSLRGQSFDSPKGHRIHPMSEKMRGALFNILGDIEGLIVLDAFAGSGALSFEAISRGAKRSVAIDIDRDAITTIVNSSQALHIQSEVQAVRAHVGSWSKSNKGVRFDLVLCDPPYDKLPLSLLQKLTGHVRSEGLFVVSWPGNLIPPEFPGLTKIKQQSYGDSQLIFYKNTV